MQLQKTTHSLITIQNYEAVINDIQVSSSTQYLDVIKMGLPAISTLNQGQPDRQNGIDVFGFSIIEIVGFFGAKWNDYQLRKCAEVLFSQYYHWTFAELKFFISEVQSGKFGKIYGQISPAYILEAADKFNTELIEARMSFKPEVLIDVPIVNPERISAFFTEFIATWDDNIENERKAREEAYTAKQNQYQEKIREIFVEQLKDPSKLEDFRKHCKENGKDFNLIMEHLGL